MVLKDITIKELTEIAPKITAKFELDEDTFNPYFEIKYLNKEDATQVILRISLTRQLLVGLHNNGIDIQEMFYNKNICEFVYNIEDTESDDYKSLIKYLDSLDLIIEQ